MHMLQLQLQRQYPCGSHGGDLSDDAVGTNQTENPLLKFMIYYNMSTAIHRMIALIFVLFK